jgi:hypothetical protein
MAFIGKDIFKAYYEARQFARGAVPDFLVYDGCPFQGFVGVYRKENIEVLLLLNVAKVKFYPLNAGVRTLPKSILDVPEAKALFQRLLAVFDFSSLFGRAFNVFLHIRHRVFEFAHAFAKPFHELRYFLSAEKDQDEKPNEKNFLKPYPTEKQKNCLHKTEFSL